MVGAVIVRNAQIVATGYHRRAGEAHAEIDALQQVTDSVADCSMYVNLEPCCHIGRTGPCTDALISSGIRRVVVGIQDPNPQVNGGGIARLRDAGIEVVIGVCEQECHALNLPYLTYIQKHRPLISLKVAMSLDARIATRTGDARWLSGSEALRWSHQMRDQVDAILIGANTVMRDDPSLNVRLIDGRDPLRIILDSRLRTSLSSRLYNPPLASGTMVVTTDLAPEDQIQTLRKRGVRVDILPQDDKQQVDLNALLKLLYQASCLHLLVEGGGQIHGSFLSAKLVDQLYLVLTPHLIGSDGKPAFDFTGPDLLAQSIKFSDFNISPLGTDLLLHAIPKWSDLDLAKPIQCGQ
jgi:diaminohydroxyphosphoribosylaminopyrimidine deaminase/5-amino-6-(5-phosphoribosylamino)uracil reductase